MIKINTIKNISFTEILDVNKTDKIRKNKVDKISKTNQINRTNKIKLSMKSNPFRPNDDDNSSSSESFFKALSTLYNNTYTQDFFFPFKTKILTPTKNALNMIFSNEELVPMSKFREDIAKERRKSGTLLIENAALGVDNRACNKEIDKLTAENRVYRTKINKLTGRLEEFEDVAKDVNSAMENAHTRIHNQAQELKVLKEEKLEAEKQRLENIEKQRLETIEQEKLALKDQEEKRIADELAQKQDTDNIAKACKADHEKFKSDQKFKSDFAKDQAARETNQKLQEQQKINFEKERLKNRTNSERVNDYIKKIYNHSLQFKKNNPFIITKTIFGIFILKLIILNRAKILKLIEDRQKIWKYKAMAYLELATLSIISVLSVTVLFNNSASVLKYVDGPSLKVILSGLKSSFDLYVNEKIESRIIKSTFLLISKSLFLGIPFSSEVAMTLLRYAALDYIVDNKISKNFRLDNLSIVKLTMRDF
jgi:hypothetical protein